MKYNIYAGLGGSFGGAHYHCTGDFNDEDDATQYAFELAVEEYESYEGHYGIKSWYDIAEEAELNPENSDDEEEIDEMYREERESWIDYYAIPFEEDDLDEEIVEI